MLSRFPGPDGLCGNDDCGQMSVWYVFSALGFYPVAPGSNQYVLGSPCVARAVVDVGQGRRLTVGAAPALGRGTGATAAPSSMSAAR